MQQIPIGEITTNADQPRKSFYKDSLEELAQSIRERGILEPLVVRPFKGEKGVKYQVVMGERRLRAAGLAGLKMVPAIVKNMSDEDVQADALLENFQREDLNAIEKANAIQGLLAFMSWEKVGKTLGVSETTLRRSLELLELPDFVQYELTLRPDSAAGPLLGEGHARMLAGLNHDPASQRRMVDKIKKEKLNQADTEKIINAINKYPTRREAFLRVPIHVTEQILRSYGARAERAKPYKPQTADQHVKAIEKVASQLTDLIDERLIDFLDATQMNHLLATAAALEQNLDEFNIKVRKVLNQQDGFKEVYINCPLCGKVELIGSLRCSVCWSILRRCYDCGNYDRTFEKCSVYGAQVFVSDAENPKEHSKSYQCQDYRPKYETRALKTLKMVA
jgi:ParB family chromosome partitioning protein